MSSLVNKLRRKYPQFIYEDFSIKKMGNNLRLRFFFKVNPDICFSPEITIRNINQSKIDSLDEKVVNNLAFHLGLMEIPSYWKATCSPEILIRAGFLEKKQILWWKDLLMNGMGEFFYTNKINFTQAGFVKFKIGVGAPKWRCYKKPLSKNKLLVLVGGGKDSIITLQALKEKRGVGTLLLNPRKTTLEITTLLSLSPTLIVEREIDTNLLELNKKGYLNGHTPFSAYLAFLGVMMAVFFGFGSVVASNERSAEEENLVYLGRKINHQYSKTFCFEKLFAQYTRRYLAQNLSYFSFLRPLWELQITRLFASYPRFFPFFRSCNRGQKTNSWCSQCPKCLSTFILLYPFLEEKQLKVIFGKNLFKDPSLLPALKTLTGGWGHKPFECVATHKEILAALYLGLKKSEKENQIPILLDFFQKEILSRRNDWKRMVKKILTSWNNRNLVPQELAKTLKEKIEK